MSDMTKAAHYSGSPLLALREMDNLRGKVIAALDCDVLLKMIEDYDAVNQRCAHDEDGTKHDTEFKRVVDVVHLFIEEKVKKMTAADQGEDFLTEDSALETLSRTTTKDAWQDEDRDRSYGT